MMAETTTTGATFVVTSYTVSPQREWGAYGVLAEDGGISWQTYKTVEEAKRDRLYRGRAKIIHLRLSNEGVELERTPSEAELFMRQLRDAPPPPNPIEETPA